MGLFFRRKKGDIEITTEPDDSADIEVVGRREAYGPITYDYILNSEPGRFELMNIDMTVKPFSVQSKDGEEVVMGLMPHEVLYLFFCERMYLDSDENISYFGYYYGMNKDEYNHMVSSLRSRGFIQYAGIEERIKAETIKDIKPVLKKYGLPVSGKKDVLVSRLLDNVDSAHLEKEFPRMYNCLTESGKAAISNSRQIMFAHRNGCDNLSIWIISKVISNVSTDEECVPAVYKYLDARAKVLENETYYGLSRNCRLNQLQMAYSIGDYDCAMHSMAILIRGDLSGVGNNYNRKYLYISAQYWFPYEDSLIKIAPAIKDWLKDIQEALGYTEAQLKERLISEMQSVKLPFEVFSTTECAEICLLEMHEDITELEKIYANKKVELANKYQDLKLN